MDFELTEEQTLLRDTARDLLSRAYDTETRNKVVDTEPGWSREVWNQLAEIGIWLGLRGFRWAGASGIGCRTQLEVHGACMTEIGRRLAPGSRCCDAGAARPGGADRRIRHGRTTPNARRGGGRRDAAGLRASGAGQPVAGASSVATSAERQGDSWVLTGTKNPVLAR